MYAVVMNAPARPMIQNTRYPLFWALSMISSLEKNPLKNGTPHNAMVDTIQHAAFMTTAYMTRATYLTFFGTARGAAAGEHHEVEHAVAHDVHDTHAPADAHDAHDAHDTHTAPHESPALITVPLVILASLALLAGYLNAAPFKIEKFTEWFASEKRDPFPELAHASFEWINALPSILLVAAGFAISLLICRGLYGSGAFVLKGITKRSTPLFAAYTFLEKKYYLDALYENVIVRGIAYPISRAAYWVNQNVIDRAVNEVGLDRRAHV